MEQKSDVQFRAVKEYKNSREKFFLLLREIISNSIHAVLIRQSKEPNLIPNIKLDIYINDSQCKIELKDNGEGFNENNSLYFEELDKVNPEKDKFHFHPLGQGRLAIVYFSDSAEYETVYKDKDGNYKKRNIQYPQSTPGLYQLTLFQESELQEQDTYTKLTISITKPNSLSRAKTFFNKYSDSEKLKNWFIENFFPFIVNNANLAINVSYNGTEPITIKKDNLESEVNSIPFGINLLDGNKYQFKLWLIKKTSSMIGDNPITCFARNLRAELSNGKLNYSIDNKEGYLLYLTSDYFDEYVDTKGEKIEISEEAISKINQKLCEKLDEKFKTIIANNQNVIRQNWRNFKKRYPSLETFVNESNIVTGRNIIREDEIIKRAIEEKSRIEKKFWTNIDNIQVDEGNDSFDDSMECEKLLNSSLHIYVKHRESVLKRLKALIKKFDEDGEEKPELESTVHDLFLKRGTTLRESSNINHLHNLWILDDKFTTFSNNNIQAKSTKQGQSLSDVYIWADDPEKTKQILILELKSTTKAHNAGSHTEGMIAQVRRYAQNFYKNPVKVLNWDIDTSKVQYTGIIIARKSDINKELSSDTVGNFPSIPFLDNSYYGDDVFSIDNNPKNKMKIRIELYSYEDIYNLASSRNEVFFRLLKNEFGTLENEK